MITFHNPGELDPRLITTFGVSIKETNNPIGYFGTGLKYAIAVLVRTGHNVEIHTGNRQFTFGHKVETIRGKEVTLVYMTEFPGAKSTQLPFSIDLGRNWEVWMAYRELACNAMDEAGGVVSGAVDEIEDGHTYITVQGKPIAEVHKLRHKYFITGSPVWATSEVEVYARSGKEIFYRGVKIGEQILPGLYTYNLLASVKLTEDRTIAEQHAVDAMISTAWFDCPDEKMLEEILTAKKLSTAEGNMEFSMWHLNTWGGDKDRVFCQVVRRLVGNKITNLNPYARKAVERITPAEPMRPRVANLSEVEAKMLARAIGFLVCHFDFPADSIVLCADNLGDQCLGMVIEDTIWVSRKAFSQGTKMLAGTIYEEWIHIEHSLSDESRAMQNFLLDKLMSMAENVAGEPL